jgi:2-(1,2-epoxy-1,2-dihydrophenyl)acetyl-CoA isomerase
MSSDLVLVARQGATATATVTLNNPRRLNALDSPVMAALLHALREVARDESVRAVVLTGEGRASCAGGDLRASVEANPDRPGTSFLDLAATFHLCIQEIRGMSKPVLAAINGPAAGGGFSMALACDLRLIAASAYLQQAYTSAGLVLDGGGTFSLPRLVGMARALEIAFLDERISAERALALGLVTAVVPDAELAGRAMALATRLAGRAVGALGRVKRLINASFDTPLEAQMEKERLELAAQANTPEGREGLAAFLEKRPARFEQAPAVTASR